MKIGDPHSNEASRGEKVHDGGGGAVGGAMAYFDVSGL